MGEIIQGPEWYSIVKNDLKFYLRKLMDTTYT